MSSSITHITHKRFCHHRRDDLAQFCIVSLRRFKVTFYICRACDAIALDFEETYHE